MIPPGIFIPIAEQTGLIVEVDSWILQKVCWQIKTWREAGLEVVPVAVNLSMKLFRQPDLPGRIGAILEATATRPEWIHLEVTESTLMENSQQTIGFLEELREQGLQLAIDDFGTGYSSLNYLKRFPVQSLKIDQCFIRDLSTDNEDAVIVLAIIRLAHSLGLRVTAEGVETQEQLDFLRLHRCDCIQGYFTGRPAPAGEVVRLLTPSIRRSPAPAG
jgi:EAL domain-containing protein (putative c-di-GMP-specific phosphodiesterase class I)